jgi:hypothetical protein
MFKGSGQADRVTLFNEMENVVYDDDFEDCETSAFFSWPQ